MQTTVSPNAISLEGKSYNKKDIYSIDYRPPRNIISALWFCITKYAFLIILLVGIPFAILEFLKCIKYHRVILTLKEYEKGKRKQIMKYVTKEESDNIQANF